MNKYKLPEERQKPTSLRKPLARLHQEFLRPYRLSFAVCLVGLLVQSMLVLPVPILKAAFWTCSCHSLKPPKLVNQHSLSAHKSCSVSPQAWPAS